MTTITIQQQPKSIAALSPAPTNTSPETEREFFFFFPCQIEDAFGTSAPGRENTTPSNSGCLQASENTMHFHKRIFIQPWLA